ncbi:MAG: EFR1 family ferrodoxin [Methanimicrococcus sp.]|nr:EFR1 family ferrodoxin [Methanimicrococcus sp.]
MTHRIYYFSGTGNSLWVTRKIRDSLPDTEIIPITRDMPAELAARKSEGPETLESVGLVFPVYLGKPPRIVLEFIRKMPKTDYIYAVATCGMIPGKPLADIKKGLLSTGNFLSAGYIVPLISNFIVFPKTKTDAGIEKAFKKAEAKAQIISMNVQKKASFFDKETPSFLIKPAGWLLLNRAYHRIPELDEKFSVNDECDSCGACRNVCPVQNIQITASKPVFLHNCELCFSCINWCPRQAINWTPLTKKRRRYHCKGISQNDVVSNRYYKNK